MDVLSIGQLAAITGGQLRLGNMPPLGGMCEPVRRIVHTAEPTAPGDVVLQTVPHAGRPCWLESAYTSGALGVIGDQWITPWDGRFSLQIANPGDAVEKLAGWIRTHAASLVTLIITPPDSPTRESECEIQTQLQRLTTTLRGPAHPPQGGTTRPWLWPLLGSYQHSDAVLLTAEVNRIRREEIIACRPDVVVLVPGLVTEYAAPRPTNTKSHQRLELENHVIDLQHVQCLQRCLTALSPETAIICPETLLPRLLTRGRPVRPYRSDIPQDVGRVCAQAVSQIIGRTETATA